MLTTTRRGFLQAVAAGSALAGTIRTPASILSASDRTALDAARKQAAGRRRRIIYNNDGDDIWGQGADTVAKFLALRHDPLLNTQVDTISYCTTQSFSLFTHASRVAEVFLSREGTFAGNNLPKFLEQQTDGLRMSCEFARKNGLESLWTLRMNDIHDAWTPQFVSQWKKDDPRRVMAALADVSSFNDRRRLWSLVDFEHPDVEPQLLAIIEEVLRNYPIDGIELDFLRAPFYFRTTYEGQPATDRQMSVLTRLVENIRRVVLAESDRQNKPFLLGARVPVTQELCRYLGIDIAGWLSAGLIDVLAISGGYVAFDQPVHELIELGHRYEVPVYPCLSQSGLLYRPPRGTGEPLPLAAWKGAAMRFLEAGADGVYCFNLFPGPGTPEQHEFTVSVLKSIGAKETLEQGDRLFAVSDAGWSMPEHYWARDAEEYSRALPVALEGSKEIIVPLIVAGPVAASGTSVELALWLDFTGLGDAEIPTVSMNSHRLEQPARSEAVAEVRRVNYVVRPDIPRTGSNEIRVEGVSDEVKLAGAELRIHQIP